MSWWHNITSAGMGIGSGITTSSMISSGVSGSYTMPLITLPVEKEPENLEELFDKYDREFNPYSFPWQTSAQQYQAGAAQWQAAQAFQQQAQQYAIGTVVQYQGQQPHHIQCPHCKKQI